MYQFDLGRNRMIGPAPRITVIDQAKGSAVKALPGYPTFTGVAPPQGAVLAGSRLFVAGGDDGDVVVYTVSSTGLTVKRSVPLPSQPIRASSGAIAPSGTPFVLRMGLTPQGNVVAFASDVVHRATIGYLIDSKTLRLIAARQFPGSPTSLASNGRHLVVTFGQDEWLYVLDDALRMVSRFHTPGQASAVALPEDDTAVVGVDTSQPGVAATVGSSRITSIDLHTGRLSTLRTVATPLSGPLLAEDGGVWWGLPEKNQIELVGLDGTLRRSVPICHGVKHLGRAGSQILATCLAGGKLDSFDLGSGAVTSWPAGGFPSALVVGPA